MTKATTADETLRELWAIKDDTAARFRSVAAYVEHLKQAQRLPASAPTAAKKPKLSTRPAGRSSLFRHP
jgi:hypothetical protein